MQPFQNRFSMELSGMLDLGSMGCTWSEMAKSFGQDISIGANVLKHVLDYQMKRSEDYWKLFSCDVNVQYT